MSLLKSLQSITLHYCNFFSKTFVTSRQNAIKQHSNSIIFIFIAEKHVIWQLCGNIEPFYFDKTDVLNTTGAVFSFIYFVLSVCDLAESRQVVIPRCR